MSDFLVTVLGAAGEELAPMFSKRALSMIRKGKARLVTIQLTRSKDEKDGNVNESREIRTTPDAAKGRRS